MALRGSIELTTTRLLTSSSVTTRAALAKAASVALASPMSLSQSKTMLPGMWSKSCGAPGAIASLASVTAGSGVVVDLDRFGGIARGGQRLGDDQRDRLADVPHLAERQHGTRRVVPRRAVTVDQRRRAGHVAETVCPNVLAGSTNSTPGMRRAAAASMRLICACAMGERSTKACVIRGRMMSSV